MINRFQVVEYNNQGKKTYHIERKDGSYMALGYLHVYNDKQKAIELCKLWNEPAPPPPTRRVIYP